MSTQRAAAIYARQSLDRAEGIDRQLERCKELAEARGYTVVETYQDNETSASKVRGAGTAWARMLREAKDGRFDVLLAVDLDRLLRSLPDLLAITETNVAVLTVDGQLDLTSADGEFRATMLTSIARFETRRKGERQLRANEYRASKAMPNPGRRRFGYESNGREIREAEAVIVRSLFERFREGVSVRSLSQDLVTKGIDPAPGRSWSPRRVRYILQSEVYTGSALYKGQATRSEAVQPIVSAELAEEVRALLSDPTRKTTPGPGVKHLLSGLARCAICDAPLVYMRAYMCRTNLKHVSIQKKSLDPVVRAEVVKAILFAPSDTTKEANGDIPALASKLASNSATVAQLFQDRAEGLIPPDVARSQLIALKGQREAAEKALELARAASATGTFAQLRAGLFTRGWVSIADAAERANQMGAAFDALDLDRQRELVRTLLSVRVEKGRASNRVKVEHLVATSLNDDSEVESE
ncbi:recombinase family protein [Rathayibacter sp. AY1B5]|uniref:recombinase family protein n=1 Tax=Rathayibacter sp. AY1B5 TaxID=2080530 RepID=UPI000CE8C89D|nr:recombinase family protein [Rathayibacter sp. AY1B5]PPI28192.1 hypothetical protein C5D44_00185 [Rathayibacter sp. AY1B5]